jgi:hypothetical protein
MWPAGVGCGARNALRSRSAGRCACARSGDCHQRSATMIPRLLAALTQKGDAIPIAPISTPASAGPIARLTLMPTLFAATAPVRSSLATSAGTIACQAGAARAAPAPSRNVKTSRLPGRASSSETSAAKIADRTVSATSTPMRNLRRSNTSASTPAGSAKRNMGAVVAT